VVLDPVELDRLQLVPALPAERGRARTAADLSSERELVGSQAEGRRRRKQCIGGLRMMTVCLHLLWMRFNPDLTLRHAAVRLG
jgi:hypothetical protein